MYPPKTSFRKLRPRQFLNFKYSERTGLFNYYLFQIPQSGVLFFLKNQIRAQHCRKSLLVN
jgi:hypothetical protein